MTSGYGSEESILISENEEPIIINLDQATWIYEPEEDIFLFNPSGITSATESTEELAQDPTEYIDMVLAESLPSINLPEQMMRNLEQVYHQHQAQRAQQIMHNPYLAVVEAIRQRNHYREHNMRLERTLAENQRTHHELRNQMTSLEEIIRRQQQNYQESERLIRAQATYIQLLEAEINHEDIQVDEVIETIERMNHEEPRAPTFKELLDQDD